MWACGLHIVCMWDAYAYRLCHHHRRALSLSLSLSLALASILRLCLSVLSLCGLWVSLRLLWRVELPGRRAAIHLQ